MKTKISLKTAIIKLMEVTKLFHKRTKKKAITKKEKNQKIIVIKSKMKKQAKETLITMNTKMTKSSKVKIMIHLMNKKKKDNKMEKSSSMMMIIIQKILIMISDQQIFHNQFLLLKKDLCNHVFVMNLSKCSYAEKPKMSF